MTSLLRKLSRWLDCLAFANAGNIGDFNRLLQQRKPAAPASAASCGHRPFRKEDANFARWLALWNGAPASGDIGGRNGKVDENV